MFLCVLCTQTIQNVNFSSRNLLKASWTNLFRVLRTYTCTFKYATYLYTNTPLRTLLQNAPDDFLCQTSRMHNKCLHQVNIYAILWNVANNLKFNMKIAAYAFVVATQAKIVRQRANKVKWKFTIFLFRMNTLPLQTTTAHTHTHPYINMMQIILCLAHIPANK